MKKKLVIYLILLLLTIPPVSESADWYVKKGAAGTNAGTLANPWNELNQINQASLSAGDTVYIAGGTYTTALAPVTSGTSGSRIYYKRIRSTDAACSSPCDATWDGQVIINVVNGISWGSGNDQDGSYVTIDGRVASGIYLISTDTADTGSGIWIDTGVTGITVQYVEIAGPTPPHTYSYDISGIRGIVGVGRGTTITSPTFSNMIIHDCVNLIKLNAASPTIQDSTLYGALSTGGMHANILITNSTTGNGVFRRNTVYNYDSEGLLIGNSGTPPSMTWYVYNNVFRTPAPSSTARVIEAQYAEHTLYLYNNTIDSLASGVTSANGGSWSASSKARNNVFYNVTSASTVSDSNYNAFSGTTAEANSVGSITSAVFRNYAGYDYNPAGGTITGVGADLSATFTTDKNGTPRPIGSAWTIGAYQYISTYAPFYH